MPDIEPEEVDGLQNQVSILKSIRNRNKLTINENPKNEFEWTLNDCINRSRSFRLFCHEVHPDDFDRLLPLCLDLDFYLCKSSTDDSLTFNLKKHDKFTIYQKLYNIWTDCLDSYTEKQWYYNFLANKTNLANKPETVRKGLSKHNGATGNIRELLRTFKGTKNFAARINAFTFALKNK